MRISNISNYLGGARNVIAEEIVQQDSITKTIDFGTANLNDYVFELETELYAATVTEKGSNNITINSFLKVASDGTTSTAATNATTTAANFSYGTYTVNADSSDIDYTPPSGQTTVAPTDIIQLTTSGTDNAGKIDLKIPTSLVSNLAPVRAPADVTTPYIVTAGLKYTNGTTIRTLRFVWVIRYSPFN